MWLVEWMLVPQTEIDCTEKATSFGRAVMSLVLDSPS